jgi:putative flippase GtrA
MLQFITKAWQQRGIRYLLIGGWNTIFGFGSLVILKITAMPPLNTVAALTIASALSVIQSYVMQRKFVWRSKNEFQKEFLKFVLISISQYVTSVMLMTYLVEFRKFPLLQTQFIVSLSLVAITFVLMRSWTFASHHQHEK